MNRLTKVRQPWSRMLRSKLLVVVVMAVVGLQIGSAIANVPLVALPLGTQVAEPGVEGTPMPMPRYSVNENGMTFGSAADAPSIDLEPDLVRVVATNGREGYVLSSELAEVSGLNMASPAEAIERQENASRTIPTLGVFAVDGQTVIGEFRLSKGE